MTYPHDLRVGVDGFNLALAQGTGVASYARSLLGALNGLGCRIDLVYGLNVPRSAPPSLRETLFFAALAEGRSGGEPPDRTTPWSRVRRRFLSPRARDLVEVPVCGRVIRKGIAERVPACDRLFTFHRLFYLGHRYLLRHGRLLPVRMPDPPAIMHWTYPVPVRMVGSRNVYTIHDLVPVRLPFLSLEDKSYHERLLTQCIESAAHILTVSDASRQDILDFLPVSADRVTNTYQAVSERFERELAPGVLAQRLRTLFDLEPVGYFLFYGAIEPKKNVGRLIEAYLTASIETPLVIVGPEGWRAANELRLIDGAHGTSLRGAARIRRIGFLPPDHLEMLVRGARALVFPSLYEGFGLPVVEAMQSGVPVIAGDGGALREIVGGAGLLVDPYDVDAIGDALSRLDGDATVRAELIAAGTARAVQFGIQAYRARIGHLHERLLAEPIPARRGMQACPDPAAMPGESM